MNFIRHHWFGVITGLVIFAFLSLFMLILLSPRQDALRRGFIPCTEEFVEDILKYNFVCSDFFKWNIGQWRPKTAEEIAAETKVVRKKKSSAK
jgi:hypothetical protein